jgi:hypothetical protein
MDLAPNTPIEGVEKEYSFLPSIGKQIRMTGNQNASPAMERQGIYPSGI